jgi:hypothetical protein
MPKGHGVALMSPFDLGQVGLYVGKVLDAPSPATCPSSGRPSWSIIPQSILARAGEVIE